MSSAARWSIVMIVVAVGLAAALWGTIGGSGDDTGTARDAAAGQGDSGTSGVTPGPYRAASAQERTDAGIAACPGDGAGGAGGSGATTAADTTDASGDPSLADIPLVCMADGNAGNFAELAGGKPTLVNLWAYWCEPCRRELPELVRAQERLGDSARVVLVHSDPAEGKGLSMLRELGVTDLPSLEDSEGAVAQAAGTPPVLPVSVLVRPDGTVARVLPQVMRSPDDVLSAMGEYLGVDAAGDAKPATQGAAR
ncbi:TlpA family protein disulfide reductase [Dietzia sp.]|uniref:TlpA family protein disulfide reductase n=1 Tax=Dietzia sp. TaxID=1871616 RepID=UPI002FD96638